MNFVELFVSLALTIGWEKKSYVVNEADGQLIVWMKKTGTNSQTLSAIYYTHVSETAVSGKGCF